MPMLLNNGIVDNIRASSDMKVHIGIITGENTDNLYYGQIILKYLFKPFAESKYLDTIYLWFNFSVLLGISILFYFITKEIIGKHSIIVPIIVLFVSTGILGLFKYGVIFNVINMYLILPMIIYLFVSWYNNSKNWKMLLLLALVALFSVFHYTGLYLAYTTALVMIGYGTYSIFGSRKYLKVFIVSIIIIAINIGLSTLFIKGASDMQVSILDTKKPIEQVIIAVPNTSIVSTPTQQPSLQPQSGASNQTVVDTPHGNILVRSYNKTLIFVKYISPFVILLLILSAVLWKTINYKIKGYLYIVGFFAITLIGGYYLEATRDYNRLALDGASMLAIFTSLAIGIVMKYRKSWKLNAVVYGLILIGAIQNIIIWIGA